VVQSKSHDRNVSRIIREPRLGAEPLASPGQKIEMIESKKLNAIANAHSIIKYPLLKTIQPIRKKLHQKKQ
jgi:hypothetical protein